MDGMARIIAECQELHSQGRSTDEIVSFLHARGCSKVQSITVIATALGIGLTQAKEIIHTSQAWMDIKERDEHFHDSLERAIKPKRAS